MVHHIDTARFTEMMKELPVIDVRSPDEYGRGHVSGSVSLPLFDNDERKVVGTAYKKSGRDNAILKGLDIAGKKLSGFVNFANSNIRERRLLMHCWRGGMRSESMAWLLSLAGHEVFILKGGYKAYRRYIRKSWEEPCRLIVLSGKTGTGKTDILRILKEQGYQVLDIEYHARHKGSAFGALGEEPQPTNEQFENNLAEEWIGFDRSKHVWIEDESQAIGHVRLPDMLFEQIRNSLVISVEMPKEIRIGRLVQDYSRFAESILISSVNKIERRLGGQNARAAVEAMKNNDFKTAAGIILDYYDKTYGYGLARRDPEKVFSLTSGTPDPAQNTKLILDLCKMKNII